MLFVEWNSGCFLAAISLFFTGFKYTVPECDWTRSLETNISINKTSRLIFVCRNNIQAPFQALATLAPVHLCRGFSSGPNPDRAYSPPCRGGPGPRPCARNPAQQQPAPSVMQAHICFSCRQLVEMRRETRHWRGRPIIRIVELDNLSCCVHVNVGHVVLHPRVRRKPINAIIMPSIVRVASTA